MSRTMWLIYALTVFAVALRAQTATGSLSGTVRDPGGSSVPAAKITLTNLGTNEKRSTAPNGQGYYSFPFLPPATYRAEVEAPGFKRFLQERIKIDVALAATLDVPLELGSLAEQITVSAQASLLESGTSSLGHIIDSTSIANLPLNGRNSYGFAMLVPGVRASRGFGEVAYSMANDQFISINGSRPFSNSFLMDGGANSAPIFNGPAFFPSVDTVQEYKVQTNNVSAEFSDTGGGVINVITKSGTNALHGTLYEFLRNDKLDATDFFVNRSGKQKSPYRFNQFGATAGGPILLPKIYNGRNRSFFFSSYEGLRWVRGMVSSGTLPTLLERQGDFSQNRNNAGQLVVVYDPLTSQADPARPGSSIRSPFPGNRIPPQRFDAVSKKVLNYIPLPNAPGNQYTNTNNFLSNFSFPIVKDEFSTRIDHSITDNQKIFGRFSMNNTTVDRPAVFGPELYVSSPVNGLDNLNQRQVTLNYTNILRPTLVLELSSSFLRYTLGRKGTGVGFDTTQLGFPDYFHQLPGTPCFGQWGISGMGISNSVPDSGGGFLSHCGVLRDSYESFHESANLTKVKGAHTIKTGGTFGVKRLSTGRYDVTGPTFNFSPGFTQGPDPIRATTTGGIGFASFLLGIGDGSVRSDGPGQSLMINYYGIYVQDDWRVTPKLTFNLGIRYDYSGPWTERYNRIANFDFTSPSPLKVPGMNLTGGLMFPGTGGVDRGHFNTDLNNFGPRFGFAYTLNRNTVLRGGFGILTANNTGRGFNGIVSISGFEATTPWVSSLDNVNPTNYLSNPFPNGFVKASGSQLGLGTLIGQSINGNDRDIHTPYSEQWNFNIQRTLPAHFFLDVAYAGSRGIHLFSNLLYNVLPNSQLALGDSLRQLVPNPFFGTVNIGTLAAPTVQRGQLLRPYPQFTGVGVPWASFGASTYHSMQAKLERRFASGFSFMASYTLSKLFDDAPSTPFGGESVSGADYQDNDNRRSERALATWDAPHQLTLNSVWELPFGRGRRYLKSGRVLGALVGGWQLNGIATMRSGVPLRLTVASNTLFNYGGAQRPNWNGQDPSLSGPISDRIDRYFDTSAFTNPAPYTFGNTPRLLSKLRGPGVSNLDLSVFKNFAVTEKAKVQFRAEVFNVLNHPNFGLPNTNIGSSTAGVIASQVNLPRDVQLALKVIF